MVRYRLYDKHDALVSSAGGHFSHSYVLCGDGIEVFPVTATGFAGSQVSPVATISTPSSTTNIVANFDGRLWLLLSDGTIDVLPPQ